ncbi:hypothetical protein CHU92_11900 [Flavobacterium cyanobacteriorum]|uniref:DUF2007 domain-containing protein n=1 Tax=Flavobacterium cyanobacteriorum TaxID=2022802 RepID=A0A255YZ37_9FLAO|nr:DUF2007 domain-containing protein [Flavobacterium cyanobacteriorum]OYQ34449.1 hypothetical protein CHU92_11900 [Flavobacterium cyanobacteriorum]
MESMFTKIGAYQYTSEALIIKGKLQSEGIDVFMADNHTIDFDPLISNAIGGVKLFVRNVDAGKAKQILFAINRYSVDDSGNPVICPQCSSSQVDLVSTIKDLKSLFSFLFSLLLGLLPFYVKYKYCCNNCKNQFL